MPAAVIIGAGPGLGRSMARRLGREGYRIALLSRKPHRNGALVQELVDGGAQAITVRADVHDSVGLSCALDVARDTLGDIDVVYYGPSSHDFAGSQKPVSEIAGADVEAAMGVVFPAADVVTMLLPSMVKRKTGSFLFTSAISAVLPIPALGAMAIPAAASRNYAVTLNSALAQHNIYVGVLTIGGLIRDSDIERAVTSNPGQFGAPDPGLLLDPDRIADIAWDLITERRSPEVFVLPGRKRVGIQALLASKILHTPVRNGRATSR
jgi:NAD(P)-dependent dehydrogenase (short-subunit alcohol dehydrogenase family)